MRCYVCELGFTRSELAYHTVSSPRCLDMTIVKGMSQAGYTRLFCSTDGYNGTPDPVLLREIADVSEIHIYDSTETTGADREVRIQSLYMKNEPALPSRFPWDIMRALGYAHSLEVISSGGILGYTKTHGPWRPWHRMAEIYYKWVREGVVVQRTKELAPRWLSVAEIRRTINMHNPFVSTCSTRYHSVMIHLSPTALGFPVDAYLGPLEDIMTDYVVCDRCGAWLKKRSLQRHWNSMACKKGSLRTQGLRPISKCDVSPSLATIMGWWGERAVVARFNGVDTIWAEHGAEYLPLAEYTYKQLSKDYPTCFREMINKNEPPPREWLEEKLYAFHWEYMLERKPSTRILIPERVRTEFMGMAHLAEQV